MIERWGNQHTGGKPIEQTLADGSMPIPFTTCVLWVGAEKGGYGVIARGKKHIKAHRLAYELEHGPIPEGMLVRHKCDNPMCVNTYHLEVGTHLDNMRDRAERGRDELCKHLGEQHGMAKLTEQLVAEIRVAQGSQRALAKRYGISKTQVGRIRRGESWGHIGRHAEG